MAITDHQSVASAIGHFRSSTAMENPGARLTEYEQVLRHAHPTQA